MEHLKLVLLKRLIDLLNCSTYLSAGQEKSTPEHLLYDLASCLSQLALIIGLHTCNAPEPAAVLLYLDNAKPDSYG